MRVHLRGQYEQLQTMADKLEHGHLHISVFGRVSAGKSSLLNALLGQQRFAVGPLHGVTQGAEMAAWQNFEEQGVFLIDTPGINEVAGEVREQLAHDIAARSDLVLFVAEGDLTETELVALRALSRARRPLLLTLNKADRYTTEEIETVVAHLRAKCSGIVAPQNVVPCAASPAAQITIRVADDGSEQREEREQLPDLAALKERLWSVVKEEGKTLAALNASLFAGQLSDQVNQEIAALRKDLAEKVVRTYSVGKGLAVAFNPIPIADLLAAATMDIALVVHLGRIYGIAMSRRQAGRLIATIVAQIAALMGAVWSLNLVSAALKGATAGLSTAVTAGAQGALAYYATYLVGQAAQNYFVRGGSWGDDGPKQVVQQIVDSIDRTSILRDARDEILATLK